MNKKELAADAATAQSKTQVEVATTIDNVFGIISAASANGTTVNNSCR